MAKKEELKLYKIIGNCSNKKRIYESKKQFKNNFTRFNKLVNQLDSSYKTGYFWLKCFELQYNKDSNEFVWVELDKEKIKNL